MDSFAMSQQENVMTLLAFDDKTCNLVRNIVDLSLFDSVQYRDIVGKCIGFIDQFHKAPGDHLPDLLDNQLNGPDRRKSMLYYNIVSNMKILSESINREYVVSKLSAFLRQQRLKQGVLEAAKILQADKPQALERAEEKLLGSLKSSLQLFDPGTFFTAKNINFDFLMSMESPEFYTGVDYFDERGIGPARKELLIYIAPPKSGKTWWLINLAKNCVMRQLKVCHITLEMSEKRMQQRYLQAFFSVSKHKREYQRPVFVEDEMGRLASFTLEDIPLRPAFTDPGIYQLLSHSLAKVGDRIKLVIKEFPTGSLTINALRAYLDGLEQRYNFVPDLLLVDYLDLMNIDTSREKEYVALGKIGKDLRGICGERNIAGVTPSQTTREGSYATQINPGKHVAGDFSKIATADSIITYSQTQLEKSLGLARLYFMGRNDEDNISVLISQAYGLGQFCMSDIFMGNPAVYWKQIDDIKEAAEQAVVVNPALVQRPVNGNGAGAILAH